MASVLQPWVMELPLMQQSVLLGAVRGPDGLRKEHPTKNAVRWYRRCVLVIAFNGEVYRSPFELGGGNFTGPVDPGLSEADIIALFADHLDELPFHYATHFLFAVEILGYKHPEPAIRAFWHRFYLRLVQKLNLRPEPAADLEVRLGDQEAAWRRATGNEPGA